MTGKGTSVAVHFTLPMEYLSGHLPRDPMATAVVWPSTTYRWVSSVVSSSGKAGGLRCRGETSDIQREIALKQTCSSGFLPMLQRCES